MLFGSHHMRYLFLTKCCQHVLAIAILSVCPFVRPSHGWISQKRCKLESPIFTIGCLEDSSFRTRTIKLFHKFERGHPERKR